MKLNHINLPVADVSATRDFFEKHFGFRCVAEPTDANVVLTDDAGLVLTISNFDHADDVTYPKWFHVGFIQESDDKVDDIYERLNSAGIQTGKPENLHGAWSFYFTAPGGFTVEVFHQRGFSGSEGPGSAGRHGAQQANAEAPSLPAACHNEENVGRHLCRKRGVR